MGARILALAEREQNAKQIADCLEAAGYEVVTCASFVEAINTLKHSQFDLIISDVHLENGGDVFDFLKWTKAHKGLTHAAFALFGVNLTKRAKYLEDSLRTTARVLGAERYIALETFDPAEFAGQITQLLAERAKRLVD